MREENLVLSAEEAFYQPRTQAAAASMSLIVASATGPAEISNSMRRALEELAPAVAAGPGRSMTDVVNEAQGVARVLSILLVVLGGLATALASVGLYGSLAGWVARRRRELGTRLALGASPGALWVGAIGSGVLLTSVGVVLGGAGAALVGRSIRNLERQSVTLGSEHPCLRSWHRRGYPPVDIEDQPAMQVCMVPRSKRGPPRARVDFRAGARGRH